MTLKELLEKEAKDYRVASQEYRDGSHQHWWFAGQSNMCKRLLRSLDDETLDMQITLKEDA